MYHSVLADATTYLLLERIDQDIADERRGVGCGCGGRLHQANYARKPRGIPVGGEEAVGIRFSFCCAEDGCRRRTTPESVRFLGRHVYVGAVVIAVTTMRHGPTPTRLKRLRELFGVDPRTVRRWREYWQTQVPTTKWWAATKGRFMPSLVVDSLPHGLVERMTGSPRERLISALRLLCPLSTISDGRH